jgi:hypothetical protein
MAAKKNGSARIERDAKTREYVKTGTEKRRPERTVTEPRKPKNR